MNDNEDVINCFQIVAYHNSLAVTNYQLIGLDNEVLYESSNYIEWQTWICDLSTTDIAIGTQFKLKALNAAMDDAINDTVLTYMPNLSILPNPATVYFENHSTDWRYVDLYLLGKVYSSYKPPLLACSRIKALNYCANIVSWEVYTLDGRLVESTDDYYMDLNAMNIEPGTLLKFKAVVAGGTDAIAYVTLKYSPDSLYVANFEIFGIGATIMLEVFGVQY